MNRPLFAWSIFGVCLVLTFAAVRWLTTSAWLADQARQQALMESEIQNALWQMDSLVAPLLAIEVNRPSLTASFANTPMLDSRLIKGYVVRDATGHWTIRRNGLKAERQELAGNCPLMDEDWRARLAAMALDRAPHDRTSSVASNTTEGGTDRIVWPTGGQSGLVANNQVQGSGFGGGQFGGGQGGQAGQIRTQLVEQVQQLAMNNYLEGAARNHEASTRLTPLQSAWVQGELVLVRQRSDATPPGGKIVEICWLNWPEWETMLSAQLKELSFPVRIQPCPFPRHRVVNSHAEDRWRMVSLPVRLQPIWNRGSGAWPQPLIAVWGLLIAVAIAFAGLLWQTLNLSERRAAFVSAVTHELRTPLTTFRLYTEMLSDGVVSDPEQQQSYFQTLHREANRLTHLVENVLAYARLEHGRSTSRNETLSVGELIDRCRSRLEQRTAESPLVLSFQMPDAARDARLTTNAMAVEQVLFNLIDNSCKYASEASDPRIECAARLEGDTICISVCDFGPGLSAAARRALFKPFQKSSSQAAESAPGIGLGLALSYRLARDLQGTLTCHQNSPTGLCFELRLPSATFH